MYFSIVSISLYSDSFLIWWQLKIIGSRWEIDVSYVRPKKVFSATLCGAFNLVFWFCVFDHSLCLFSSHGFHILCRLSSISFLVLVFSFSFILVICFIIFSPLLLFVHINILPSPSIWFSVNHRFWREKGLRFKLVTWGVCSRACLLRKHVGPSSWMLLIKIWTLWTIYCLTWWSSNTSKCT